MKELKDYLHLYLGCEVEWWNGEGNYILDTYYLAEIDEDNLWEKTKPILRPLSDMTEEEMNEILRIGEHQHNGTGLKGFIAGWKAFGAETFLYLLSEHFDLFDLIEAGLAIDKTKSQSL